jgi:hypothetical protein
MGGNHGSRVRPARDGVPEPTAGIGSSGGPGPRAGRWFRLTACHGGRRHRPARAHHRLDIIEEDL